MKPGLESQVRALLFEAGESTSSLKHKGGIGRRLESALERRQLHVLRVEAPNLMSGTWLAKPGSNRPPVLAPREPEPAWIEVQVIDASGEPMQGESYSLALPNGVSRTGETDETGMVRAYNTIEGLCKFHLAGEDWKDAPDYEFTTNQRHQIRLPDPPRINVSIDWHEHFVETLQSSEEGSIEWIHQTPAFEVLINGSTVSYAVEMSHPTRLELSFGIPRGEHDVLIRRKDENDGAILFAQRLKVGDLHASQQ